MACIHWFSGNKEEPLKTFSRQKTQKDQEGLMHLDLFQLGNKVAKKKDLYTFADTSTLHKESPKKLDIEFFFGGWGGGVLLFLVI